MQIIKKNITLISIALTCATLLIYEPLIFQIDNISNIFKQASLIAIFALAQSIVLITKGLDLSQGGVITFTSVIVALLSISLGLPVAIIICIGIGLLLGLLNGFIVAYFKVSPFVVSLGLGFLLQGIALVLSNGQPIYNVPQGFSNLGWSEVFNIPIIIFIVGIIALLLDLYLRQITYGRYLFAIGSNEKSSFLSGINVKLHKIIAYMLCASLTAVGAIILASRINSGHPVEGANTALQSVAASVIGGVSLFGGKGSVAGVLLGSLLLAFISNSLNIINVSTYYQQIMIGIIIIFAVIIDKLRLKNLNEIL